MTQAVVALQIDGLWLGIDASLVLEILGECRWVALPGVAAAVPGVVPWRGRAIAVLDLASATGLSKVARSDGWRRRALVVKFGADTLAIPVDEVREVLEIDEEAVRDSHATRLRYARGEVELRGVTMPMLDAEALMADLTRAGHGAA